MGGGRRAVSESIVARVREAVGAGAVVRDPTGTPRVTPASTDAVAGALDLAHREGWRVRVEGSGTWCPSDAPCDLAVTTAGLTRILSVAPGDMVATVEAGVPMVVATEEFKAHGAFLAWDPPGTGHRTPGGIVAAGTDGPLRHGFGPVRDHLLGCTLVTGDGRVLRPGGTVVKNVAGYDLTRLMAGGFGAFGVITELHLRLRALPGTDRTCVAPGNRDDLTRAARDLMEAGVEAAALELLSPGLSPGDTWLLLLRLMGTTGGVAAELDRVRRAAPMNWVEMGPRDGFDLREAAGIRMGRPPVTIRLGALVTGLDETLDLLHERLDLGLVSAGAGSGGIRWSGDASLDALRAVRDLAAEREIPVTLERAPWALRERFGHFGRYREGVGLLVARLRETFDPGGIIQVPLGA
jgi:glycolate oxidase FAD binding subunit